MMSVHLNIESCSVEENHETCQQDTKQLNIFTYQLKTFLSNEENKNDDKVVNTLPNKFKKKHSLSIADSVISILIIGPLVISHWRGVWNLMDFYGMPFSGFVCFLIGTGLHLAFVLLRELLHYYFAVIWRDSNPLGRAGYHFVRLLYTYIFSVTCNMQWRGGWIVLSSVMGENELIVSGVTLILVSLLLGLRSSRNLLAPPCIIIADVPTSIFKFPTRYRKVRVRL